MDVRIQNIGNVVTDRVLPLILASILLFPACDAYAGDIAIYRWVDKNNVVHFSQNLPTSDNYTQLTTVSSFKALSKEERKALKEQEEAEQTLKNQDQQREDTIAANKATFEKNCKAAKLNIKMLNSYDEVLVTVETSDGKIENRVLTEAEKQEKLDLSKKHEEQYCVD